MGKSQYISVSVDRGSPQPPPRWLQASSPSGGFGWGPPLLHPSTLDPRGGFQKTRESDRPPPHRPRPCPRPEMLRDLGKGETLTLRLISRAASAAFAWLVVCWKAQGRCSRYPVIRTQGDSAAPMINPAWPAADCSDGYQQLPEPCWLTANPK